MIKSIEALRQHQLVILRRLRNGPLTEFELGREVSQSSGYTQQQVASRIGEWLEELRIAGLLWVGTLSNAVGQSILAAALTRDGRALTD